MTGPGPVRNAASRPCVVRGVRRLDAQGNASSAGHALLEKGLLQSFGAAIPTPQGAEVLDGAGLWLIPGWVDIQVNDVDWLSRGKKSPREHATRMGDVAAFQAARGVTGLVLATLAAPLEEVLSYLEGMKIALDAPADPLNRTFLGGLVEGTFMNPALCGAQNPRWVLRPDQKSLDALLDTGAVQLINIAPETCPEAVELIAHATRRGAVVGAGHAKPHAMRLREAVDAGLRYAIHLGNGPTGSSLKAFHDGGMLEECLRDDRIAISVILDGIHVHPEIARDWIARKEPSRVILTSDAGFAMGPPPGEFEAFGIRGAVSDDGRYLRVKHAEGAAPRNPLDSDFGALFGSKIGMREVFENALNLLTRDSPGVHVRQHPALPLEEAMAAATRMCSLNPARLLQMPDPGGTLLVEILGTGGAHEVRVHGVWLRS